MSIQIIQCDDADEFRGSPNTNSKDSIDLTKDENGSALEI